MHECPVCGQACDCDGDDLWCDAPDDCSCECEILGEDEYPRYDEVEDLLDEMQADWPDADVCVYYEMDGDRVVIHRFQEHARYDREGLLDCIKNIKGEHRFYATESIYRRSLAVYENALDYLDANREPVAVGSQRGAWFVKGGHDDRG
jgi:hypothetical protein